ncbi:hypothetical protein ACF061_13525 [Streptomyces sp. NPDC015220]|uniref:hypothetical protein n=1 Tax=Streptomyces sp. NPDC015220 TaxID=3364947 RepID=UPI0036FC76E7
MAKRRQTADRSTKPLVKTPIRIGPLDAKALIAELRQLHEAAGDPDVERMPEDEEIYAALLYAEKHASALRRGTPEAQCSAALHRVRLWEYLREQTDLHQLRAVTDARGAGVPWARLAPALAVAAPSAAYNKAKRLQAVTLTDDTPAARPVRRTPEAVLEAERRRALEAEAERRRQEAAERSHRLLLPVARRLLEQRSALVLDEDAEYWLDEISAVLPDCATPTQMVSLDRYLGAAVRSLRKLEQRTASPVTTNREAHAAYLAAAALQNEEGGHEPPSPSRGSRSITA